MTMQLRVPTRDGAPELHLLSHVPSERASAAHLAQVYGKRWRIATAFLAIPTTVTGESQTLASPQAAWCTFCLALLAYNAVALSKAALRHEHGRTQGKDEVSSSSLA